MSGSSGDRPAALRWVKLTQILQSLKESIWFIPATAAVLALLAAVASNGIDQAAGDGKRAWFLFEGGPDSARQVLAVIAGSIITFTGLVFSITIVVLQLASGQFSPRVVQTFVRDQRTQIVMGVYVATFAFALITLSSVRSEGGAGAFVPAVGVSVALLLTLGSLAAFVYHVNHVAHSVRAATLLRRVGKETRDAIEELFPDPDDAAPAPAAERPEDDPDRVVRWLGRGGAVRTIDEERLVDVASEMGIVVRVEARLGDHLRHGGAAFSVWGGAEDLDERRLTQCIGLGRERTIEQDAAYGLRQMVDIAARALSPGTNDPSTAVQALDEIHDVLGTLADRPYPPAARADPEGRVRVIVPRTTWDDHVNLSLAEILQYGERSVQVLRRVRHLLLDLRESTPEERRAVLDTWLERLDRDVKRTLADPLDAELASSPDSTGIG